LERFFNLAADDNIQIVIPSTPAQHFHVLRRQVVRPWRKPLIVLTPKSLLRHPQCTSTLEQCTGGSFQRVIPETRTTQNTQRILLCSGKIYYELQKEIASKERDDIAVIRVEQLYPFPDAQLAQALEPYAAGTPAFWVQEEPENMGAWYFLRVRFGNSLFDRYPFEVVSRPASASPATGSASSHRLEQAELIRKALGEI
jgi:2-oxoglutarate dehydrogenase E1 component